MYPFRLRACCPRCLRGHEFRPRRFRTIVPPHTQAGQTKAGRAKNKKEIEKMRDERARNRIWGSALVTTLIGGTGFIHVIAGILSLVVGAGVGLGASFARGANDRLNDILVDYDCSNGIYIVFEAEATLNSSLSTLKGIKYLDVVKAIPREELEKEAEWV